MSRRDDDGDDFFFFWFLVVPVVLILTGCASGGGGSDLGETYCREAVADHTIIVVLTYDLPVEYWGYNLRNDSCDSRMSISPDVPPHLRSSIIIHELFHAVGYDAHVPGTGCYFSEYAARRHPSPPCPRELEMMLRARSGGSYRVYAAPDIYDAVADAVDFWNFHTGVAGMFVVYGTTP
jgi:hypothetical protein